VPPIFGNLHFLGKADLSVPLALCKIEKCSYKNMAFIVGAFLNSLKTVPKSIIHDYL